MEAAGPCRSHWGPVQVFQLSWALQPDPLGLFALQDAAVCAPGVPPYRVDHAEGSEIQLPVLPHCLLSTRGNGGKGNGGQRAAAERGEGGGAGEQSHPSAGKGSAAAGHIELKAWATSWLTFQMLFWAEDECMG